MGEVYSERFALAYTGLVTYTVPAGRRAVVKFMTGVNVGPAAGAVAIFINDILVWQGSIPSGQGREFTNLMFVARAGEVLKFSPTPDTRMLACGFLLYS